MGKRGPQPKPTALKKLLGNPGKRRLNEDEPIAPDASPDPPLILRPEARPFWDQLAPALITMKVMSAVDVLAFARYCNLLHRYHVLDQFLMTKGAAGTTIVRKNEKGKVVGVFEVPQAWEYRDLHRQLLGYEREFGLTPAARTRLHVEPSSSGAAPAAAPATEKDKAIRDFFAGGGPAAPRAATPS